MTRFNLDHLKRDEELDCGVVRLAGIPLCGTVTVEGDPNKI
jgi:hypothetical protein